MLLSFFIKMTIIKKIPIPSSHQSGCGGYAISCGAVFAVIRAEVVPLFKAEGLPLSQNSLVLPAWGAKWLIKDN